MRELAQREIVIGEYYVCIMCVISKSMSACNGNCAQTVKTTISFCKYFCIIICQTRKA